MILSISRLSLFVGRKLTGADTDTMVQLATEYLDKEDSDSDAEDIYATPLYRPVNRKQPGAANGVSESSSVTSAAVSLPSNSSGDSDTRPKSPEKQALSEEVLAQITMEMQALEAEIKVGGCVTVQKTVQEVVYGVVMFFTFFWLWREVIRFRKRMSLALDHLSMSASAVVTYVVWIACMENSPSARSDHNEPSFIVDRGLVGEVKHIDSDQRDDSVPYYSS